MSVRELPDAPAEVLAGVPEGYTIRTLTSADIDELAMLDGIIFGSDAWPLSMFVDELAHPQWRRYWGLATRAEPERLVGYLGLQYSPRIADIQSIGVLDRHRRKGLADFLLRVSEERAKAWGAESMMLEVRVDNEAAKALYMRHGFEAIHTRPRYYPDGTDALIMARDCTTTPPGTSHHSEEPA